MPEKLLSIRRPLDIASHQELLQSRERVTLYPDQVKWRRLGQAGLTYLDRGQYARNTGLDSGKLRLISTGDVANSVNEVIQRMPTEPYNIRAKVNGVRYMGNNPIRQIAYILEAPQLSEERGRLIHLIDRMNGAQGDWDDFLPHISVASVGQVFADDQILEQFDAVRPDYFLLSPANALVS